MKGLSYQQYIYKRVSHRFIADIELQQNLKELDILKYAELVRYNDDLSVKFTFPGDQFISLSDLINLYTFKRVELSYQCAFKILNSILIEFQKKYSKIGVDFDSDEIWISNGYYNSEFQIVFTQLNIFNDQKPDSQIQFQQFQILTQKFLKLFRSEQDVSKLINHCQNLQNLKEILSKNQDISTQLQIVAKVNNNVINAFNHNDFNKLSKCINKKEDYNQLKSNIINWVVKENFYFDETQNLKVQDIFEKLQLDSIYKILTTWQNSDEIVLQLQMQGIFGKQSSLKNINDFIFILAFPQLKNCIKIGEQMDEANKLTLDWLQSQEQIISQKIQHYIKNIFTFYKGDKEEWEEEDYKNIFLQVRESAESICKGDYYQFQQQIQGVFLLRENTLDIIKHYYQEKLYKINEEILQIMHS